MRWFPCALAALALGAGCTTTPPPACITVDTNCAPGYVPTFDNVYKNTLAPTCGASSSCHSADGHMGNLSFPTGSDVAANEQTAYSELLSPAKIDPSRKRVVPGDPSCSLMIVRTDSPGASYQMPPGVALSAPERCALVKWVACGAPGPGSACP